LALFLAGSDRVNASERPSTGVSHGIEANCAAFSQQVGYDCLDPGEDLCKRFTAIAGGTSESHFRIFFIFAIFL